MLVVMKFGGTSVADAERINAVANRIAARFDEGHQIVCVLSAQGDLTDRLVGMVKEITDKPLRREMDMLLSTGEQQSVALMAMALQHKGYPAVSLTGTQCGILTTSDYGKARIKEIVGNRIQSELDQNRIVLVTGFQGVNKNEDITTLGRGGSDTSAVALAARLRADLCEIYTDVDGIYSADPRFVQNAAKLESISYNEMLELASLGAKVLHKRSVELAKKYNVKLVVRSSFNHHEGTIIEEGKVVEDVVISGVVVNKNIATVSLIGIQDVPGIAFKIFSRLAKADINIDIILQSVGRDQTKDIVFTIDQDDLDEIRTIFAKENLNFQCSEVIYDDSVAKVSIVGGGLEANPGVASNAFEALAAKGINIKMISTSEIKISLIVDEVNADLSVQAIHAIFFPHTL